LNPSATGGQHRSYEHYMAQCARVYDATHGCRSKLKIVFVQPADHVYSILGAFETSHLLLNCETHSDTFLGLIRWVVLRYCYTLDLPDDLQNMRTPKNLDRA
jgi:hypothetical protein